MAPHPLALHQSTVYPLDPVELVAVAAEAGFSSIGLRVANIGDEQHWWSKGIGSQMLRTLSAALLSSGVTVLDVGRIELGPELAVVDSRHAYMRALELGVRLGARFVTVRARAEGSDGGGDDPAALFAVLAELAGRYQLRPLLAAVPGTPVDTVAAAVEVVRGTGGGVVLDVSPRRDGAAAVADTVGALGSVLGYVRVPARELTGPGVGSGLLSTLPAGVPVAVGGAPADLPDAPGPVTDDHVARVRALRHVVDAMVSPTD